MQTVPKLLDAIRNGDREAFAHAIEPEVAALRPLAVSCVDAALQVHLSSDDLLQETRLYAYRYLINHGIADDRALRAWLARILERVASNNRRRYLRVKKRGGHTVSLSERKTTPSGGEQMRFDVAASGTSPSQGAARLEGVERLRRLMDELPEDSRKVIQFVRFEGKSFADAAECLGRSEAATRKLLSRSIEALVV